MEFVNVETIDACLYSISPEFSRMYRFLIDSYENPYVFPHDEYYRTPIHYAAFIQSDITLQIYLNTGNYNINSMDILGDTALMTAINSYTSENSDKVRMIVHTLLSHGADPNMHIDGRPTPLMLAIMKEDVNLVIMLLMAGADSFTALSNHSLFFKQGDTALSIAVRLNTLMCKKTPYSPEQLDIIRYLVSIMRSVPEKIFHALQQTSDITLKNYIHTCM